MATSKRKPGRPKGSGPGRKYTAKLIAWLTPDEKKAVTKLAKAAGLSLSKYVRRALGLEEG
jgi:predicted HicB family RNase H-like nuclease|tara:strand:- start:781 stop:963 length:183 start_codon:yes stop_codon:yes gene_type:complete